MTDKLRGTAPIYLAHSTVDRAGRLVPDAQFMIELRGGIANHTVEIVVAEDIEVPGVDR